MLNPPVMNIIAYALLATSFSVSIAVDTSIIMPNQHIRGIVSKDGVFELGFFTKSNKSYLGILYKNIPLQNVVWVANGDNPIISSNPTNAILELQSTGNLVLTYQNTVVWRTNSTKMVQNPVAELLDSGNLVVREKETDAANPDAYLWQSFDQPCNTMMAGMKLGWDLRRKVNRCLRAWKSDDDPAPGDLSWCIELHSYPDTYMKKGTKTLYRLGPWNGMRFSGMPELKPNPIFYFNFVSNKDEVYYTWNLKDNSLVTIAVLNQTSYGRPRYVWSDTEKSWRKYSTLPGDYCDTYGLCGPNGYCSISEAPVCQCLKGFRPNSTEKWNSMDWSLGCVRVHPLSCDHKLTDGFVLVESLKLPDTERALVNETIGLDECRVRCLHNCSCMAYTNSNISGAGSGCVMWFGNLFDIRLFPVGGQGLYIRMPASEFGEDAEHGRRSMKTTVGTTIAAAFISLVIYSMYRGWRKNAEKSEIEDNYERYVDDLDLPLLDFSTIMATTNNFSVKNKIGEGGFGPVYWGKLEDGQEIAVKRLSKSSGQGMYEFINEVKLIAKLQHRNLVKLLVGTWRQSMLLMGYFLSNLMSTALVSYCWRSYVEREIEGVIMQRNHLTLLVKHGHVGKWERLCKLLTPT